MNQSVVPAYETFLGQRVLLQRDSRTQLPLLAPMPNPNLWKALSKVIGQDLAKANLPAAVCEPLCLLQRQAELLL